MPNISILYILDVHYILLIPAEFFEIKKPNIAAWLFAYLSN